MSIFAKIRSSCSRVADNSTHVKIRHDQLDDYVAKLLSGHDEKLIMDDENHFCGSEEDTINYFLVLDSINFGSGYFSHLQKAPAKSGYFTVASRLKDEFLRQGGFSWQFLSNITSADCTRIFKQQPDNGAIKPLMEMFARAMNELGAFVKQNFSGDFKKLVLSAGGSANLLVETLGKMKMYQDFCEFHGEIVHFYKRAQITVSDINIALNATGAGYFKDISELTIFADNLVPHVLWLDGLLEYTDELAEKIRNNIELQPGSDQEIELRAAAVHSVELLRAAAMKKGIATTSQSLDYIIWNRGQASKYRVVHPHICKNYFY